MLVVMVLERVPAGLRGDLSRWLLEPKAGVFVGNVTADVRDRLWQRACRHAGDGACLMVHAASDVEQRFVISAVGDRSRTLRDFDGLALVALPPLPGAAEVASS
jgi:CRISPR-associated protein Cas2